MKNRRIFAKTWFRVGSIALVLGAVLLVTLLFNLPASAYPPESTPQADAWGDEPEPAATPQQGSELRAESRHSAGATLDSTPLSLTGSYYEWGYAKTCRDVDSSTSPPTCIGETSTFYCDEEEMHNVVVLYDVTQGGYVRMELYRPDGTLHGQCEIELDDPHDFGYEKWTWYFLDCRVAIAGSTMVDYPGNWHTDFKVYDYSQWINEATLWWELICEEECPGASEKAFIQDEDNENNQHTGSADGDMSPANTDCIFRRNPLQPIEFNIVVPSLPSFTTAQLIIRAWDVDEQGNPSYCPAGPERDRVTLNGHVVGYLTGASNVWSTSTFDIDPAWVHQGNNLVQVDIDTLQTGCWCTSVEWGQLVLGGGGGAASIHSPGTDRNCYVPGMRVTVLLNLHTTLSSQEVEIEINIVDSSTPPNTLVGTSQVQTIYGPGQDNHVRVDVDLPLDATPGY